jgi:hypothetical protein
MFARGRGELFLSLLGAFVLLLSALCHWHGERKRPDGRTDGRTDGPSYVPSFLPSPASRLRRVSEGEEAVVRERERERERRGT